MNTGNWWLDMQDQLAAGAMIVLVLPATDKTHLTNFSGDHHASARYLTISNIRIDIHYSPNMWGWVLLGLISCSLQGAKNTGEVWHSAVVTVLFPLQNLDITRPSLKWTCADGFQRQCYPLLAAWVGDYPEQVMVVQVPYGSCPMCEIPNGALMRHSTLGLLDYSRDQHV